MAPSDQASHADHGPRATVSPVREHIGRARLAVSDVPPHACVLRHRTVARRPRVAKSANAASSSAAVTIPRAVRASRTRWVTGTRVGARSGRRRASGQAQPGRSGSRVSQEGSEPRRLGVGTGREARRGDGRGTADPNVVHQFQPVPGARGEWWWQVAIAEPRYRRLGIMGAMVLSRAFTEAFSLRHPIALAPMGGSAGGALAAAVSNGGGLGLVGCGDGNRAWVDRELAIVAATTAQPWGVGFLTWASDVTAVERVLDHRPLAVMLSFGDPGPFVEAIRRAGAGLMVQVTDVEEARRAVEVVPMSSWRRGPSRRAWRSPGTIDPAVRSDRGGPGGADAGVGRRRDRRRPGRGRRPRSGRGRSAHRHSLPRHRRGAGPPRRSAPGSSTDGARTPSAAQCWTSPAAPDGHADTRPEPSATRTSIDGEAGKTSSRPTPMPSARLPDHVVRGDLPPLPVWASEADT